MKTGKKDPMLLVSMILSIIGLILIYIASVGSKPNYTSIGDIDPDLVGRTVSVAGFITDVVYNPKGHIFLTISDGNENLQVALFHDYVKALNDAGISGRNFTKGKLINVTGTLDVYNNQFQIIPRKVSDLKIS